MASALALFAGINWWRDGSIWAWLGVGAAVFAFLAALRPTSLSFLNLAWFRFGLLLHSIVNPVIVGVIFYGAVVPTGLIMRALGKDPLRRRSSPGASTYWINRDPPGPLPDTMKDQF